MRLCGLRSVVHVKYTANTRTASGDEQMVKDDQFVINQVSRRKQGRAINPGVARAWTQGWTAITSLATPAWPTEIDRKWLEMKYAGLDKPWRHSEECSSDYRTIVNYSVMRTEGIHYGLWYVNTCVQGGRTRALIVYWSPKPVWHGEGRWRPSVAVPVTHLHSYPCNSNTHSQRHAHCDWIKPNWQRYSNTWQ